MLNFKGIQMPIDYSDIESYAYKLGIPDIETAIELLQEGKLPADKIKALQDVEAFAHKNGIKDFFVEAAKHFTAKPKPWMREALEKGVSPLEGFKQSILARQSQQQPMETGGIESQEQLPIDQRVPTREELAEQLAARKKEQQDRYLDNLVSQGRKNILANYPKYIKGVFGDKQTLQSDPFFGTDAFRENIQKYSPLKMLHEENIWQALDKSDLYKNLSNAGREQLPERQLYNNMLQQYQYEQARRNPINVLTGRYEYLRPQAYGPESSWITGLRNRLGFNPVTSFDQK
jgi:hypothetical protein